MLIESKKTGRHEEITQETWDKMKEIGLDRKFKVLNNAPMKMLKQEIKVPDVVKEIKKTVIKKKKDGGRKQGPVRRGSKKVSGENIKSDR